ncbi:MIP/aquaporin family protein [Alloscardovia criceti]|uniref:MIP/aquaporin family protein n=1 Tax=Alloscardovia criceti TaxID=356828 RepID=UPI000377ABE4|nr:MIP/aquaporin family protein [Alloscardovia criceti]
MDFPLWTQLLAEFFGTAILMLFGNGAVANHLLKGSKGHNAGWINIAMGYGLGVMIPVAMFGYVSGAHINPAMTIGQAVNGMIGWNKAALYIIVQLAGAFVGQLIVWLMYKPFYDDTDNAEEIFATFATDDAANDKFNYFINEFVGTLILCFGALTILSLDWGQKSPIAASIIVGFIVWGLVTSMGGATGPALNPARDLMPRLAHQLLPIEHKGSSKWNEAWIPVVAPICGAIVGVLLANIFIG